MKQLAIECSTEMAQIVLSDGKEYLQMELEGVREHSRRLLTMIDEVLVNAGWSLSDIDSVVFGRGPGSFTGLRVACSLAQGIALARDIPVYPVSGLASIVRRVRETYGNTSVLAMLDARMGQLYWSLYLENVSEAEEYVSNPEAIKMNSSQLKIAGSGFHAYNSRFDASLLIKDCVWIEQLPCAVSMIKLVQEGSIPAVSPEFAKPVYIRDSVTQGAGGG